MLGVSEGTFEIQDLRDFLNTKKRPIYLEPFDLRLPATVGTWETGALQPRGCFQLCLHNST